MPTELDKIAPYKSIWNELSIANNGILMRNDLIVIPIGLREVIVKYAHE